MVPRMRARGEPSFWLSLVLTRWHVSNQRLDIIIDVWESLPGVEVEVDSEPVPVAEVRVEVRVEEVAEDVVVELPLLVLVMVALELALAVVVADEVMVSDDRVVEADVALEEEEPVALVAEPVAALPWKVN